MRQFTDCKDIDKKDMPYLKEGSKGAPWEFESAKCINWYIRHKLAMTTPPERN